MRGIILLAAVITIGPAATFAVNCPSGYPHEIFCDDFDTYCAAGGFPGDPKCPEADKATGNPIMRTVWYSTSTNEATGMPCGTTFTLQDDQALVYSPPQAGKYPSKIDIGQQTVRDWTQLEGPPVLDLHRLIGLAFGTSSSVVFAMDSAPLVMEFFAGTGAGKLFWTSGYMEVAFGDETHMNRANTDFAWGPNCATYCSPAINQGPFQIMCAQGNPDMPLPAFCPPVETNPPPVHQAIAIGAMAMLDPDPCHCGVQAHGPINYHLALFDGQLWWTLRSDNPAASTGSVTPKDGAPMPPPQDVYTPGDFSWAGGENAGKGHNLVKLTIKANTLKVEHTALFKSAINGASYYVTSEMDDIPRAYLGSFDRIRGGVGPGCALAGADSWSTCESGTARNCLHTPTGWAVEFDDFVLHGGAVIPVFGACCLPDNSCLNYLTEGDCIARGGRWQGANSMCALVHCCPYPFADADLDGDVDQDDFGLFQICYTGYAAGVPTGCSCFNRVKDDDYLQ